jgi:hypothetical protein
MDPGHDLGLLTSETSREIFRLLATVIGLIDHR